MDQREQEIALREGAHIAASNEYFEARPQIDSNDRRKVFEAGFNRGYAAREKEVEHLKDMLRNSFMDDHLRIELHFKDYHVRKLVKPAQHIDFPHVVGVITRDMWEDLSHALTQAGLIG